MATTSVTGQRWAAVLILVVLGIFSLPVTAYFFDEQGSENWILPIAVVVMAILGAVVGSLTARACRSGSLPPQGCGDRGGRRHRRARYRRHRLLRTAQRLPRGLTGREEKSLPWAACL